MLGSFTKLQDRYGTKKNPVQYIIRHISPLMFDVIYDKPEDVARGIFHVYINTSP